MSPILALLLLSAQAAPSAAAPPSTVPQASPQCTPRPAPASRRIDQLLASADGASAATAYRVRNIGEEYQILAALGLCPHQQSLVMNGRKPYDVLRAVDSRTGAERELWFDIGAFFGRW